MLAQLDGIVRIFERLIDGPMPQAEFDSIAERLIGPIRLPEVAGEPLDHDGLKAIASLQVVLQTS